MEQGGDDEASRIRRLKWDMRYIRLARHIAEWSKDEAKIGAVITDPKRGRIISVGFNGFPQGVEDDPTLLGDQKEKLLRILHAEQNALLRAGLEAEGANVYVYGKPVCSTCAAMLIQARVKRIIASDPNCNPDSKWAEPGRVGLEMIKQSGVKFTPIDEHWLRD